MICRTLNARNVRGCHDSRGQLHLPSQEGRSFAAFFCRLPRRLFEGTSMPQRFLKPGITTSTKWNALDWFTQSFYIRLITVVDDFGRYEAAPIILRGVCFPLGDASGNALQLTAVVDSCKHLSANKLV